jgi:hypothetical protein
MVVLCTADLPLMVIVAIVGLAFLQCGDA